MSDLINPRHIQLIVDRFRNRALNVSQDYMFETFGWSRPSFGKTSRKVLPYTTWDELRQIQKMGAYLYENCPTMRSAVSKMVSYVVSHGHRYDLGVRDLPPSAGKFRVGKKLLPELKGIIEYTMENSFPGGWQAMQEESVVRTNRDGEYFRRVFLTQGNGLQIRFVEPEQIRDDGKERPNVFLGVETEEGDAVTPTGYWFKRITKEGNEYDVIPADEMQHYKQGVDANDPRGIPGSWMVFCNSMRIKEVDEAMCELAVTQAAYAVIRQFDPMISYDQILDVAKGFQAAKDENGGRPEPGREVDAKGFTFEFPSMDVSAESFIEIIQQEQRQIAGIFDMPEFLLTADSAGGNRASMISAEGPFDRRVQREQRDLAVHDVDLLWKSIQHEKGWSDETLRDARRAIRIEPQFPRASTRDEHKQGAMLIDLVAEGLKSPQEAISELNGNYEVTQLQINEHNKKYPSRKVATKEKPPGPAGMGPGDDKAQVAGSKLKPKDGEDKAAKPAPPVK